MQYIRTSHPEVDHPSSPCTRGAFCGLASLATKLYFPLPTAWLPQAVRLALLRDLRDELALL
jgi:hypothetical protein